MKKTLGTVAVLVIILAVAAWYFVAHRLDGLIEETIETAASASFGTAVQVGAVTTDLKNGSLAISNVTVSNPPGYSNRNAFSLNGIEAAVDFQNFDIKRVIIDKPEIVIEEKGGVTNFNELLARLEQKQTQTKPANPDQPEPVIVIRHFRMNESRAAFESESMDHYSDLKIDEVELKDIRGTPDEVASAIATEVINEVVSAAAVELIKAKASEKLDDILGRNRD